MSNLTLNKGGILLPHADLSGISMGRSAYAGIHILLSPVGWKPEDETFNLIEKFRKSNLLQKRYALAFDDSVTSIPNTNSSITGYQTYFYETIDGVEIESKWNRGTAIVPTAGSTNRYVIYCGIKGASQTYAIAYATGAKWAHFSGYVTGTSAPNVSSSPTLAKLTCDDITLAYIETNFSPAGTGILYLPATLTQLGYGFKTNTLQAVVSYATTPPSWGDGTVGSYTIRCDVFVPDESVNAYKAAARWSSATSYIRPLSEFDIANYQ